MVVHSSLGSLAIQGAEETWVARVVDTADVTVAATAEAEETVEGLVACLVDLDTHKCQSSMHMVSPLGQRRCPRARCSSREST